MPPSQDGVQRANSSGAVVCSGLHRAYQCAGATGRAHGTQVHHSISEREACACTDRQRLSRLSHKPPGEHQVCTVVAGVPGSLDVGGPPPSQPECNVSPWRAEPGQIRKFGIPTLTVCSYESGGHMCCGIMGFTEYLLQVLVGECCHSPLPK